MVWEINEAIIPTLAVGFVRGLDAVGDAIAFARGGKKAVEDRSFPTHAFLFTRDTGRLFVTEETLTGLQEKSLADYCTDKRRIVAVYYWTGFDDPDRVDMGLRHLVDIRANHGRDSKYDLSGLLSFVPVLKWFFKPDPAKQWCSENCASILKYCGASWIDKTTLAPDQLLPLMRENKPDTKAILGYYK